MRSGTAHGMDVKFRYPLVMSTVGELENGPVEIVDIPIKHGDFP